MTPVDYALTIPTAYTREELEFFWDKLNKRRPLSITEVGVEYGASTSLLFQYANASTEIHLIDSFIQHPKDSLPSFLTNVVLAFPEIQFTLHKTQSFNVSSMHIFSDFLHIDASHSYEDTKHELFFVDERCWTMLHDFDRKGPNGEDIYEGVGRAAREHFKREPDEIVGTCALYRS